MIAAETSIKDAMTAIRPRTEGVQVGSEIRVGRDSTDEEAVWVWVVVPDERIDEFYTEWDEVREEIRQRVLEKLGKPDAFVYIRMRAASEVKDGR
jgi:hypothetical protein